MPSLKSVIRQGLWSNNSSLVQLLGLCPLLAVTNSVTNALGLGLATTLVLLLTNSCVSLLRRWIPGEIRIPVYVMIIASVVSAVQMLINAYAIGLYQSLGIFIPLIVTNCIIIGRAEAFAAKNSLPLAALDGLFTGLGACAAMLILGALREMIGNGTLFAGADTLLGPWAGALRIELFHTRHPFLLALLPPGAFIGLGFMLAAKYRIDQFRQQLQQRHLHRQIPAQPTTAASGMDSLAVHSLPADSIPIHMIPPLSVHIGSTDSRQHTTTPLHRVSRSPAADLRQAGRSVNPKPGTTPITLNRYNEPQS